MKVIITSSALPVPVGTIMDVGEEIPAAWRGKCVPYIEDENPEWTEDDFAKARPAVDVHGDDSAASLVKPRTSLRKPKPG